MKRQELLLSWIKNGIADIGYTVYELLLTVFNAKLFHELLPLQVLFQEIEEDIAFRTYYIRYKYEKP